MSCHVFNFLEINPDCTNIKCQNGGSCIFINETSNAVCTCYNNFAGELCEGRVITFGLVTTSNVYLPSSDFPNAIL